jgi:HlyD family secretion protein
MLQKIILPLLALTGLVLAAGEVLRSEKTAPPVPPASGLPESPYPSFVAGAGLVEASTENISVGSQAAGIVARLFVRVGAMVKAGDPLFELDGRTVRAELTTRRAALQVAQVASANARYDLGIAETLAAKGVNAVDELEEKRFGAKKAEAQLAQAEADLGAAQTQLDLLTVRAPVDGQILQLKVHLGEFAPDAASSAGGPLIVLGGVSPLNVRAEVDETDAWRVPAGAEATGFLRGNPKIKVGLTFVRFEPEVVPKASLTGGSTERVDTRVLQVIFSFERGNRPIFVGQQMDLFIKTLKGSAPQ